MMNTRKRLIYEWLQDEESREIWTEYYRFCGNHSEWAAVLLDDEIDILRNSQYVIYGIGSVGIEVFECLRQKHLLDNCAGIWDGNLANQKLMFGGIEVTAPPHGELNNTTVLITPRMPAIYSEMEHACQALGITPIVVCRKYDHFLQRQRKEWAEKFSRGHRQYLNPEIIQPRLGCDEVYIDGGAFDFGSSVDFINCVKVNRGSIKKVYAFEASPQNENRVRQGIKDSHFDNVSLSLSALWDKKSELQFNVDLLNGYGSSLTNSDNPKAVSVPTISLDEAIPSDEVVTFIKLDVEGAELQALKGAKKTIRRCKPKLAISLYHKPCDYIALPEYIRSIVPEYKAYIRQEQDDERETVLYCVI